MHATDPEAVSVRLASANIAWRRGGCCHVGLAGVAAHLFLLPGVLEPGFWSAFESSVPATASNVDEKRERCVVPWQFTPHRPALT